MWWETKLYRRVVEAAAL